MHQHPTDEQAHTPRHGDHPTTQARVLLAMAGPAARTLQLTLESAGFAVNTIEQHTLIHMKVQTSPPDLLILDTRHHRYHYLTICDTLRRLTNGLPLLVLLPTCDTAQLLRTLDHGADDCLVAPFGPSEVVVRARVLLRRHAHQQQERRQYTNFEIIPAERQVIVNGKTVHLTVTEFDLLTALSHRPGAVMPRERLLQQVWGDERAGDCRVVDSHICRLRRKLHGHGLTQRCVHSVRGIGYVFRPEE